MKIIRKSLLNLIYILFILILSLSCSNNDAIEDDKKSINGVTNTQIEINKLKQQIETLQNQIITKEKKTKDIESLLQQANQDLESAESIIIELSKKIGYKTGDCPVAERQAKTLLTLPIHQYLNEKHL